MSGGYFEYKQYTLEEIADEIERLIATNSKKDEWGYSRDYEPDILEKFKETAHNLRRTAEMVQRVDWLVSSDDGPDSFRDRWKSEVRKEYNQPK